MSRPESAQVHPDRRTLRRFLRAELGGDAGAAVVRHLLTGCPRCVGRAAASWRGALALRHPDSPTGACGSWPSLATVTRIHRQIADLERQQAVDRMAELVRHPSARQLLLVRNSQRFRTVAVCRLLLRRAFELGLEDPRRSLAAAELALAATERLQESRYGIELVRDLEGRAWFTLANARRIAGDLPGSERAFQRAESLLEQGTGDPAERAAYLARKGLLRSAQRRFADARRLLDRAIRGYRSVGDRQAVARTRITKGGVLGEAGELELATRTLELGLEELDSRREPRTALVARHNLIHFLLLAGRTEEAAGRLPQARAEHRELGHPMDLLRLRWLEAKLDLARGRLAEAETGLEQVVDGFLEHELPYPAAIAITDLALVYLAQGRNGAIGRRIGEVLPVFRALRVERETLAALALLVEAARRQQITRARIEAAARSLSRGRSASRRRAARRLSPR